jgi:hypothetical protein
MARDKTTWWNLQRFYWPTVYKDIDDHCQTCAVCQTSRDQRLWRVPLALPIIGGTFERITMDIVGPLNTLQPSQKQVHTGHMRVCDQISRSSPFAYNRHSWEVNQVLLQSWHPKGHPNGPGEQLCIPDADGDLKASPHPPHYFVHLHKESPHIQRSSIVWALRDAQ